MSGETMKTSDPSVASDCSIAQWKPIETAPKDGSLLLVTGCNGWSDVLAAWWVADSPEDDGNGGKAHWRGVLNCVGPMRIDPTHWMPLPAPPTE